MIEQRKGQKHVPLSHGLVDSFFHRFEPAVIISKGVRKRASKEKFIFKKRLTIQHTYK